MFNQDEALEALKHRLKDLRKKQHYTQAGLGSMLGVSAQTVSGYESGTIIPGPEVLLCYCDIFHCDANYLMQGIEEKDTNGNIILRDGEADLVLTFRKLDAWKRKALLSLALEEEVK